MGVPTISPDPPSQGMARLHTADNVEDKAALQELDSVSLPHEENPERTVEGWGAPLPSPAFRARDGAEAQSPLKWLFVLCSWSPGSWVGGVGTAGLGRTAEPSSGVGGTFLALRSGRVTHQVWELVGWACVLGIPKQDSICHSVCGLFLRVPWLFGLFGWSRSSAAVHCPARLCHGGGK